MAFSFKSLLNKLANHKKPVAEVSGIYLGGNRYMRVIPQPSGQPEFVAGISGVATLFELPSRYGNIGLIAHNYLSGKFFLDLKQGDNLYILDGFGKSRCYQVINIRRFQALQPRSPRSNFIDLDTQEFCSASEVFKQVYMGDHRLVLQTCIEKGNIEEWGRFFVIAEPAGEAPPAR